MDEFDKLISFYELIGKLKDTERTGWVNNNIKNPESVSDHIYGVALLSIALSDKFDIDQGRALKMALVHDLGESIIGDVVTAGEAKFVTDPKKKAIEERKAMVKALSYIDGPEYLELFDEYEAGKTKEAKFVKQLDKLEMALQALIYEKRYKIRLDSFYLTVKNSVTDPYLTKFFNAIEKQRPKP